jgi:hypothetical protein
MRSPLRACNKFVNMRTRPCHFFHVPNGMEVFLADKTLRYHAPRERLQPAGITTGARLLPSSSLTKGISSTNWHEMVDAGGIGSMRRAIRCWKG